LLNHTTPIEQLNKICAADYSEATMELEEWAVEDSDTGENSDILKF